MKLFDEDSHITDEGFRLLAAGEVDELGRLELSEHMDFCDQCVARYSEQLTDDLLQEQEEEITPAILRQIRQRNGRIFMSRFAKVSMAAGLAIVIWVGGFYRVGLLSPSRDHSARVSSTTRTLSDTLWNWSSGLDKLLSGFSIFLNTPPEEDPGNNHVKE